MVSLLEEKTKFKTPNIKELEIVCYLVRVCVCVCVKKENYFY